MPRMHGSCTRKAETAASRHHTRGGAHAFRSFIVKLWASEAMHENNATPSQLVHRLRQNSSGTFPVSINSTIGQCPASCFSAIIFLTAPGMLPPMSMQETFSIVIPPS